MVENMGGGDHDTETPTDHAAHDDSVTHDTATRRETATDDDAETHDDAVSSRRPAVARGTTVRATRQGDAVWSELAGTDAFTSAQDLHARLREQGRQVGLTTVYRHLQVLAEAGDVDVLRRSDGETLYRRCATDSHHHHLVCRMCGRTVEVEGAEIEAWTAKVAAAAGFSDVDHTVEIYGTCSGCR